MRSAREFPVVLRARDQQVTNLQDHNDTLKVQLETLGRRLTNARANAHADSRIYQLQERKIEQLRMKLRDARAGSAAQRQELEDARRESGSQKMQLAEAHEENRRHLARIAELEEAQQTQSSPVSPSDVEFAEFEGVSHDDIMDVLTQVAIDLEEVARMTEEISSMDQPPEPTPRAARARRAEIGIQTVSDEVPGANRSAEDTERLVSQAQAASERDQRRAQELEADLDDARRLNGELRVAAEEERRLVQNLKATSNQEQSRIASLEDASRQDQKAIKALETTADQYRSQIDSLEAQVVLLRALLEESRTFNDDLEESYNSIVACKDIFIQDLREKVEDLATSAAWSQQCEAVLHDAQDRLAAADIEILELRLELEGAQQNAVASTNRIIQLEADASAARHRLRTTEAENGDLRDEFGVASERIYALEDELVAGQGRMDHAQSTIRQLRLELARFVHALARLPNGPLTREDSHDVNDTDTASDEGSIDTLVMDPDEHSQHRLPSVVKDVDSPLSANQDQQFSPNLASPSMRALEVRLEAMTLKYEAAEAARICSEDVEDILRAKLQAFSGVNLCPDTPLLMSPTHISSEDESADSPSDSEEWYSLPTIPEEDEPSTPPTLERVAPPRIQTCSLIVTKNAAPVTTRGNNVHDSAATAAESPLLPSPTLSDIWFSNVRTSLALAETGSSVLDWELPSPEFDSESS
jgi:chromosome segregation ATPase